MSDFGEYLPFDGKLFQGDARDVHNQFPELWAGVNRHAIQHSALDVRRAARAGALACSTGPSPCHTG